MICVDVTFLFYIFFLRTDTENVNSTIEIKNRMKGTTFSRSHDHTDGLEYHWLSLDDKLKGSAVCLVFK